MGSIWYKREILYLENIEALLGKSEKTESYSGLLEKGLPGK